MILFFLFLYILVWREIICDTVGSAGKKFQSSLQTKYAFFYSALAFCLQSIYNMDTHDRTSEDFFFLPRFKMKVK